MKRNRELNSNVGRALVAACCWFAAGIAVAAEPPAKRSAIEGRGADYRRLDPGVPLWPSTCDCISVEFGFKDSSGYRPVRFRFADAPEYYGGSSAATLDFRKAALVAKGPLQESAEAELP